MGTRMQLAGVVIAAHLLMSGCVLLGLAPAFDEKSGDDANRGGAVEMETDKPVDDRVSAPEADNTDWRVFELAQKSKVTITIWWDDPDDLEATVRLRGMTAAQSRTMKHKDGKRTEKLGPMLLPKGKWFVRVQATDGATVYTLEVKTTEGGGGGGGGGGDLPDF